MVILYIFKPTIVSSTRMQWITEGCPTFLRQIGPSRLAIRIQNTMMDIVEDHVHSVIAIVDG